MANDHSIQTLAGKTLLLSFSDGPMEGINFEYEFHEDGTVTWAKMEGGVKGRGMHETTCSVVKMGDDAFVMSYLGSNGYTLTAALNVERKQLIAFASNEREWTRQIGTFDFVDAPD